jgi:hypothetical protein
MRHPVVLKLNSLWKAALDELVVRLKTSKSSRDILFKIWRHLPLFVLGQRPNLATANDGDRKIYGYVKFKKTTNGWQADHLSYRQTSYPADPDLKCE